MAKTKTPAYNAPPPNIRDVRELTDSMRRIDRVKKRGRGREQALRLLAATVLGFTIALTGVTQHYASYLSNLTTQGHNASTPLGKLITRLLSDDLGVELAMPQLHGLYYPGQYFAWITPLLRFGQFGHYLLGRLVQDLIIAGAPLLILLGLFGYFVLRTAYRKTDDIKGSADFTSYDECVAMELVGNDEGILCGWVRNPEGELVPLRDKSDKFIMTCASTGTGKTRVLVIPTVLSDPHISILATDIKGALVRIASGWRKLMGNYVLIINPYDTTGRAALHNEMDEIRWYTEHDFDDALKLAQDICDDDGTASSGEGGFWTRAGIMMGACSILHLGYSADVPDDERCLAGLGTFLNSPKFGSIRAVFKHIRDAVHDPEWRCPWWRYDGVRTRTHPLILELAEEVLRKEEEEASGVYSTMLSSFGFWRSPIVKRNTYRSTFRWRDLMNADKPVAAFLAIPAGELAGAEPFLRVALNQLTAALITEMKETPDGDVVMPHKHHLRLLLEEFYQYGAVKRLASAFLVMREFGLRSMIIYQSLKQPVDQFGPQQTVTDVHQTKIFYRLDDIEVAETVSKMLGSKTEVTESETITQKGERSWTYGKEAVPLYTPDELMRLPNNVGIMFRSGFKPTLIEKVDYTKTIYGRRARHKPVSHSDEIPQAARALPPSVPPTPAELLEIAKARKRRELAAEMRDKGETAVPVTAPQIQHQPSSVA
jgi:type IV secretion system protein VirD4